MPAQHKRPGRTAKMERLQAIEDGVTTGRLRFIKIGHGPFADRLLATNWGKRLRPSESEEASE